MAEFIYVLVVIYATYVIVSVMNDNKKTKVIDTSAKAFTSSATVVPLMPDHVKPQLITKPLKKAKSALQYGGLKNPETGEVATNYTNYRFMKRWIKEALVSENLLEKIYKNNELTPEVEVKIKEAILQLESMLHYQPSKD
jgi:hypothetical protein